MRNPKQCQHYCRTFPRARLLGARPGREVRRSTGHTCRCDGLIDGFWSEESTLSGLLVAYVVAIDITARMESWEE